MDLLAILGIALALAMDAFAVSMASSVALKCVGPRQVFRFAFHFGLFQFLMPVMGYAGGLTVESLIRDYDHWIAFALLAAVGGKAMYSAIRNTDEEHVSPADPTRGWSLVLLSVATSIDALAVGLSMAFLDVNIWYAASIIGVVCAIMTVIGMYIGCRLGRTFGKKMEIFGGMVLVLIGIRILYEHMWG